MSLRKRSVSDGYGPTVSVGVTAQAELVPVVVVVVVAVDGRTGRRTAASERDRRACRSAHRANQLAAIDLPALHLDFLVCTSLDPVPIGGRSDVSRWQRRFE